MANGYGNLLGLGFGLRPVRRDYPTMNPPGLMDPVPQGLFSDGTQEAAAYAPTRLRRRADSLLGEYQQANERIAGMAAPQPVQPAYRTQDALLGGIPALLALASGQGGQAARYLQGYAQAKQAGSAMETQHQQQAWQAQRQAAQVAAQGLLGQAQMAERDRGELLQNQRYQQQLTMAQSAAQLAEQHRQEDRDLKRELAAGTNQTRTGIAQLNALGRGRSPEQRYLLAKQNGYTEEAAQLFASATPAELGIAAGVELKGAQTERIEKLLPGQIRGQESVIRNRDARTATEEQLRPIRKQLFGERTLQAHETALTLRALRDPRVQNILAQTERIGVQNNLSQAMIQSLNGKTALLDDEFKLRSANIYSQIAARENKGGKATDLGPQIGRLHGMVSKTVDRLQQKALLGTLTPEEQAQLSGATSELQRLERLQTEALNRSVASGPTAPSSGRSAASAVRGGFRPLQGKLGMGVADDEEQAPMQFNAPGLSIAPAGAPSRPAAPISGGWTAAKDARLSRLMERGDNLSPAETRERDVLYRAWLATPSSNGSAVQSAPKKKAPAKKKATAAGWTVKVRG